MPVEKLRESNDDYSSSNNDGTILQQHNGKSGVDYHHNNNNKENGVVSTSPTATKNGILHKSSSKLGFTKKKMINGDSTNGHHHGHTGNGKKNDDPFRFSGDGIDFKAKLIGVREVLDARGDQMCQDAMQLCKAIVKSSGQHKQKILFNISLDGLKIKEQSNGHLVHSFPVSKVSFIAKDVTDNRAFGFVYTSPEEKHKFYAIKTEKTSDQVVISIRDMFHVVYEMKKKQMEEAKQNKDVKIEQGAGEIDAKRNAQALVTKDENGVEVADLLDLETELQNLKQGVQDMNSAWDDFNPRAGEVQSVGGLSNSFSTSSFGNGHNFYQGDILNNGAASSPNFFSTSTGTPPSLNETVSSMNGSGDPFGTDIFNPVGGPVGSSHSLFNNQQNMGGVMQAAVPPPPQSVSRRRTTSNGGNVGIFDSPMNGQMMMQTQSPVPPTFTIDKLVSSSSMGNGHVEMNGNSIGSFTESPMVGNDPFDTSHVNRLVHGVGLTNSNGYHAASSTPIPRLSSTASSSPPMRADLGGPVAFALDTSQALSAISGPRSQSEISSPGSAGVFSTMSMNQDVFTQSPAGGQEYQTTPNSMLNQAMYGSQLATGQETSTYDHFQVDSTPPPAPSTPPSHGATPLAPSRTPKPCLLMPTPGSNPVTPQMSSSPQQTLLQANILKAPNATSVDQAFNVLCNLDALKMTPPTMPQQAPFVVSGSIPKEDLFAQMRPPPKKSINELRGSPVSSPSINSAVQLNSFNELYSSSPGAIKNLSNSPALNSGSNFTSMNAPPIPPRPTNGLLPPPASSTENSNRRRVLPQPVSNQNCGGFFDQQKTSDPFADDPFFAS